ncbi:MAG TPA: DUF1990 domain-containing protein [Pyrinomonadaceae bacterium]|nr:DUF1990 domain-containing protein [Pyrinomonadaceae bacterium]
MFTLREPSDRDVANFISHQSNEPFTYSEVGATRSTPPPGYTVDHNRIQLGHGEKVYECAVDALKHWQQFDLGWVSLVPRGVKLEQGTTVAVKAWACGMWSLNACRVVYIVDEDGPVKRFGFAYGALTDHVERGEERFLIEWQREEDSVWYDILAFSTPHHSLVKVGFPVGRMFQKRFARGSLAVMKSLCQTA